VKLGLSQKGKNIGLVYSQWGVDKGLEKIAWWGDLWFLLLSRHTGGQTEEEMGRACDTRGRTVCMILVGQPERKRHFGRCRWEDNFKMDPIERVWGHELDSSGSRWH
jgi:hypothetical protein